MPEPPVRPAGPTVALVSRNQLTRLGLQSFLAQHREIRLIGHAVNGEEAEALVARARPQILLIEPDTTFEIGDCVRTVRAILPTIRIILLSNVRNKDCIVADRSPTADRVVLTNQPLTALCAAIHAVLRPHSTGVEAVLVQRDAPLPRARPARLSDGGAVLSSAAEVLTKRESDVLTLLGEGLTNKDIARRLFICPTTVRHHLSHMFSKLDVSSRQQLLLRAQQHGLLQLNGNG
ncbi:MAG: response regulator transcription factor [Nitrospira sp.]|nr:response regulator transcription factor [Nitrospira sp.]